MTILPKKKQTKEKSEASTSEHPHGHQLPHSPPAVDQRHDSRVTNRRPNSPPQSWTSPSAREDPCLAGGHDPGGLFDEQGASGHNKRRHRSSPHRTIRKHRVWETTGHASTSGHSHRHSNYPSEIPSTSEQLEDDPNLAEENLEGYNSGDEYGPPPQDCVPENVEQLELWFERAMKEKTGFVIKKMREDGACLFRAVADQVYGDQEMHDIVRKNCIDYMAKNADFFRHYVTEDFETYLNRKRITSSHGNHIEIQAMSEIYNRPIEVYQYSIEPINTFHGSYKTDNEPIRLSYHKGVHYNSLINPVKATIGVGLGLPGLQPGLAEKNLMREAVRQSEEYHIETTMLEDKLRETDWELTQESIDEQVARESYLQWLRDQEKNANKPSSNPSKTASATCSSASESQMMWDGNIASTEWPARSPRNRSNNGSVQNSPNRLLDGQVSDEISATKSGDSQQFLLPGGSVSPSSPRPSTAAGETKHSTEGAVGGSFLETSSLMNDVQSEMFAYAGWGEDDILAQVMAQSQQEYLDSLKKSSSTSCSTPSHDESHSTAKSNHSTKSSDKAAKTKNSHSNTKGSGGKVS